MDDDIRSDFEKIYPEVIKEIRKVLIHGPKDVTFKSGIENSDESKASRKILSDEEFKRRACLSLKSFSGDIWGLSKIVTTIVLTVNITTNSVLPIAPVIIANSCIIIYRMSISAYCGK